MKLLPHHREKRNLVKCWLWRRFLSSFMGLSCIVACCLYILIIIKIGKISFFKIFLIKKYQGQNKLFIFILLLFVIFNDDYVLQLCSKTVAVRRRMMYDDHTITGDSCNPNILTFVYGKISTRKLIRPEIEPGPAAWEVTMLHLDYSGGLILTSRPQWSSGYHIRLWIRGSRVRSRPGSMDFIRASKSWIWLPSEGK